MESMKTALKKICMAGDYDRSPITRKAARESSTSVFMSLPRILVTGCGLRFWPACSDCCQGWSGEPLIVRFEEADAGAPDPEIFEAQPQSCSRSPPAPNQMPYELRGRSHHHIV